MTNDCQKIRRGDIFLKAQEAARRMLKLQHFYDPEDWAKVCDEYDSEISKRGLQDIHLIARICCLYLTQ